MHKEALRRRELGTYNSDTYIVKGYNVIGDII